MWVESANARPKKNGASSSEDTPAAIETFSANAVHLTNKNVYIELQAQENSDERKEHILFHVFFHSPIRAVPMPIISEQIWLVPNLNRPKRHAIADVIERLLDSLSFKICSCDIVGAKVDTPDDLGPCWEISSEVVKALANRDVRGFCEGRSH